MSILESDLNHRLLMRSHFGPNQGFSMTTVVSSNYLTVRSHLRYQCQTVSACKRIFVLLQLQPKIMPVFLVTTKCQNLSLFTGPHHRQTEINITLSVSYRKWSKTCQNTKTHMDYCSNKVSLIATWARLHKALLG